VILKFNLKVNPPTSPVNRSSTSSSLDATYHEENTKRKKSLIPFNDYIINRRSMMICFLTWPHSYKFLCFRNETPFSSICLLYKSLLRFFYNSSHLRCHMNQFPHPPLRPPLSSYA